MGLGIKEISLRLSLDHQVIRRWLKRYLAGGFEALKDRRRSGRPTTIESFVFQKLATLVVQSPEATTATRAPTAAATCS